MQITKLDAEKREARGTRAARRLRREGKLPGIIYGHGSTPEPVAVDARDLGNALDDGVHVLELAVSGSDRQVLIKHVQFDPIEPTPIHVDFTLVDLSERVQVSVPLEFKGTPVGTHEGGALEHNLVDVEIECRVTDIPEVLRVDVAPLELGDFLHVHELELPPDVTAVTPGNTIVCSVRAKTAAAKVEETTEEGDESKAPEIIGRKEKEEGTEGKDDA